MSAVATRLNDCSSQPTVGLLGKRNIRSQAQSDRPIYAAVLIGLVLSFGASFLVGRWEQKLAQQDFTAIASNHFVALQKGLDEYLNELGALRAMFESAEEVTREEFETFTGRLLSNQQAVQNFSWAPRVTRNEREAHERAGVRGGVPDYQIRTVLPDDSIVPSPERDEYLPIFFSSVERASRIYGVDLLSQPVVQRRLERARDTDTLSAVPDFILHSREGSVHGFLFSLPVYRRGQPKDTVEDRRRNLAGFAHGAFLTAEAVDYILDTTTAARGLDIHLFLADAAADMPPLYVRSSRLRTSPAEPKLQSALKAGRHAVGTLTAGDASWKLIAVPVPGGPLSTGYDRTVLVLLAGLLISGLVVSYLRSSVRHSQRLLRANEEIFSLAHKDALTGLSNRRAFNDCLTASFADGRRSARQFAVLYFDLDHFKDVNDTLGHPVGDLLLRQVAGRVQNTVRRADVVARFGGDEFAILQTNADAGTAMLLAGRINEILAEPFIIDGNKVHITASIGIALFTAETATPDALIMQADLALYRAKEDGRNCFRFHSAEFDLEVFERVAIADDLREAVGRGELRLYYQPQVELCTGRIIGIESLLRWQHPTRGLLEPAKFIPVAERTGCIGALGEWVVEEACRQIRAWTDLGLSPGVVSVNASASQFKAGSDFENFLAATLNRWRIEPFMMEIELTESDLMNVTEGDADGLERLRRLGLRIAIDDFGTGYSSLNYLVSYQVNRLKIAQELVLGVIKEPRHATVVRAAIRLADELGIECVAEGVADAAQVKFLVAGGCRYGQGFYFSAPVTAEQMTVLLKQGKVGAGWAMPQLEVA